MGDITKLLKQIKKLNKCCSCGKGDGGCCYFEVTRAEIEVLVSEGALLKGAMYKITDRGDLGLWFDAVSENKLNPEGVRLMLVPAGANEDGYASLSSTEFPDTFGNSWRGVWSENCLGTVLEGDLVIWGGLVWRRLPYPIDGSPCDEENPCGVGFECVDGFCVAVNDIGEKISDTELSEVWEVIPKDSFTNHEYIPKVFGVYYDFENDWISKQWDEKKNIFGIAFNNELNLGFNPVDISDWNWGLISPSVRYFHNNDCIGIWNNPDNGAATDHAAIIWNHLIEGSIYENCIGGVIEFNTNKGDIGSNTIQRSIQSNSNDGNITGNTYSEETGGVTLITYNSNKGDITGNSNLGDISHNGNEGAILLNSNGEGEDFGDGNITYNNNNGEISFNSNLGVINLNMNNGNIANNTNDGNIDHNNNTGDISTNSNDGMISYNTNVGLIYNNSNIGNILLNKNNGLIDGNSHQGNILQNMNNGDIIGNSSAVAVDIFSNTNNGIITGAQVANVTDPIVNK